MVHEASAGAENEYGRFRRWGLAGTGNFCRMVARHHATAMDDMQSLVHDERVY